MTYPFAPPSFDHPPPPPYQDTPPPPYSVTLNANAASFRPQLAIFPLPIPLQLQPTIFRLSMPHPGVAERWLKGEKAYQDNDAEALYQRGLKVLHKNSKSSGNRALACFQAASFWQHPGAMSAIGDLYRNGRASLPKTPGLADRWYCISQKCALGQGFLDLP